MSAIAFLSSSVTRSLANRYSLVGACALTSRSCALLPPRATPPQLFTKVSGGHVRYLSGFQRQSVSNESFRHLHRSNAGSGIGSKASINRSFHTTNRDLWQFRIPPAPLPSKALSARSWSRQFHPTNKRTVIGVTFAAVAGCSLAYCVWSNQRPPKFSENRDSGSGEEDIGHTASSGPEKPQVTIGLEIEGLLLEDSRPTFIRIISPFFGHTLSLMLTACWRLILSLSSFTGIPKNSFKGRQIIHIVLQQPISLKCGDPNCGERHELTLRARLVIVSRDFSCWEVMGDSSIKITDAGSQTAHAYGCLEAHKIEITTPKLPYDTPIPTTLSQKDPNHMHHVRYDELLRAVLDHMDKTLNGPGRSEEFQRYRLISNASCGTHVHIGPDKWEWPLSTIQKHQCLALANERGWDSVMDTNRISGGGHIAYNSSLKESIRPSEDEVDRHHSLCTPERMADESFPFWMDEILAQKKLPQLERIINRHGRSYTVNIRNVETAEDGKAMHRHLKNTIESRQLAGTLDAEEMKHFIHVKVAEIRFAHAKSVQEIRKVCLRHWSDPDHTFLTYLDEIGCPEETKIFYRRKLTPSSAGPSESWNAEFKQRRKQVEKAAQGDYLQRFVSQNDAARAQTSNPIEIQKTVRKKTCEGGYGRFPKEILRAWGLTGREWWKSSMYEDFAGRDIDPARLRSYAPYHAASQSHSSSIRPLGSPSDSDNSDEGVD